MLDLAREQYMTILGMHPGYTAAWINLSSVQEKQGLMQEAEDSMMRAMASDKDSPVAPSHLGLFLLRQGRVQEAERALSIALQRDPGWANAHFGLGLVAEAKGEEDEALSRFQEAARRNPLDLEAHLKAASILLKKGNQEGAIRHLRSAAKAAPTRGEIFLELGSLLNATGRWRAAQEAFERALHLGMDQAVCHAALSQIHERMALEERLAYEKILLERATQEESGRKVP